MGSDHEEHQPPLPAPRRGAGAGLLNRPLILAMVAQRVGKINAAARLSRARKCRPLCQDSLLRAARYFPSPYEVRVRSRNSFRPALGGLPVAVGDSYQFLRTIEPGSDHHQAAQTVVGAEPHSGVDDIHPDVDVVPLGKVASYETLPLGVPVCGKAR